MKIDYAYFMTEYHKFRDIMCSTKYTFEQKQDAHEGILRVYMLVECTPKEHEHVVNTMRALNEEFARRMSYELFRV